MMKVIKITALWCSSCLIMNNRWNELLKEKNIDVQIYEPTLEDDVFEEYNVEHNLDTFKNTSDIIIANRFDDELENVKQKVYTRDLFRNN